MPETNFEINATTNIQSVAQKIIRNLESLQNNFQDLIGLVLDLSKANTQVSSSFNNVSKSSKTAVSDFQKLNSQFVIKFYIQLLFITFD